MIIALQLHSGAGTGLFFFHIVCEALRSGMRETVLIKVFCNSIKDSSPMVPPPRAAILHLSPARVCLYESLWPLQPQLPGPGPLVFN